MKVVLTQDHDTLGLNGSVVEVAEGYARNYLLPHNMAVRATANVLRHYDDRKKAIAKKEAARLADAQALAQKFETLSVLVKARVGEEDKLYGTVTAKEIAAALAEQHQHEVDRKKVEVTTPIKRLGEHSVLVKVHPQVKASLKVVVEAGDE